MNGNGQSRAMWPWWVLGGFGCLALSGIVPPLFFLLSLLMLGTGVSAFRHEVVQPRLAGALPRWRDQLHRDGRVRLVSGRLAPALVTLTGVGMAAYHLHTYSSRDSGIQATLFTALALVALRPTLRPRWVEIKRDSIRVSGAETVPLTCVLDATYAHSRVALWLTDEGRAWLDDEYGRAWTIRLKLRSLYGRGGRLQLPGLKVSAPELAGWLRELARQQRGVSAPWSQLDG